MDENFVVVHGLPSTCNPLKVRFAFQSDCKVTIKDIKLDGTSAKIQFESDKDCQIFRNNFTKSISFGGETHTLTLEEPKSPSQSSYAEATPEVDDVAPLPDCNFDKIYTWSDLSRLVQCSIGIIVQPIDTTISPQDIWSYFEDSKQSRGGALKAMFPMADGILLSFKDEQVVEKVWNFRPHRIRGKSVVVFHKVCPYAYKNKVVVKPDDEKMTPNELRQVLTKYSPKSIAPKGVRLSGGGAILVNYDDKSADEKDLEATVEEYRKQHPMDLVLFMLKPDCLQIEPFPRDATEQELRTVFENKNLTNGGCVTAISRLEKSLLVHFSSYLDAAAVLEKCKDGVLPLFGTRMKMRSYHPILFSKSANLESSDRMTKYYERWLEHEAIQGHTPETRNDSPRETLHYQAAIDKELLHFLARNQNASSSLNSMLADVGNGKISGSGIEIDIECDRERRQSAQKVIQQFLSKYTTKTIQVKDATTRKMVEKRVENKENQADVCIRWSDTLKKEVVITGLTINVDSLLSALKPKESMVVLNVDPQKLRWLLEKGAITTLQHKFSAFSGMTHDGVKFTGTEDKIEEAQQAVLNELKAINCVKFTANEQRYVDFLLGAQHNTKIQANVSDIMKRGGINAILVVDAVGISIVGPSETSAEAVSRLNGALTVKDCPQIDMAKLEKSLSSEWEFVRTLESEGKILLKTTTADKSYIVGFREFVKQATEKLSESVKKKFSEFVPIDRGIAKYITDFDDEFKSFCSGNLVSCRVFDSGINLSGRKSKVDEAKTILQKSKRKVRKSVAALEKADASEFLNGNDGKDLLADASLKYKSAILLSSKFSTPNTGTSSEHTNPSHDDKCSIRIGQFIISIRQGDLTEEKSDIIVNSIAPSFKLSHSKLSQDIARKGGPSIQEELKKQSHSEIRVTGGGHLKCWRIIHACFATDLKRMGDCFIDVLREADKLAVTTVSLPVIGAGIRINSNRDIAGMMVTSFRKLAEGSLFPPPKSLRKIDIVILDQNQLPKFRDAFLLANQGSGGARSSSTHTGTPYVDRMSKPLIIGTLAVSVRQGDITEESSDAIINSTGQTFSLDRGQVSKAILKKGGREIQEDVSYERGQWLRVTTGRKLKCRKIIHVVAPTDLSTIGNCIKAVLTRAEEEKCRSLSIPAIGTGNNGLPVSQVARIMEVAIRTFVGSGQQITFLQKIDFVIFDSRQYQEFRDAFLSTTPIQAQSDTASGHASNIMQIEAYCSDIRAAEEALNYVKRKIEEALGCDIWDEKIDALTPQQEAYFRQYEAEYDVKIVRSRGKISINGLKREKVLKVREAIDEMLKRLPGDDVIWEYADPVQEDLWRSFDGALCQQLEESYQKYSNCPSKMAFIGKTRTMVDFEKNIYGVSTKIRRRPRSQATDSKSRRRSVGDDSRREDGHHSGGRWRNGGPSSIA